MNEVELAYAAGIVDGEGCVQINRHKGNHGEVNPLFDLNVQVANNDRRMLYWLKDRFGGSVMKVNSDTSIRNTCYRWQLLSSNAENFLRAIYPFLVIKKEQCDIAFEFRQTYGGKRVGNKGTPLEVVMLRDKYHNQLRALHSHKPGWVLQI